MRRPFPAVPLLALFSVLLLLSSASLMAQQDEGASASQGSGGRLHPALSHLDEAQLARLKAHLDEARSLANVRRSQEMLMELDKAIMLAPNYYMIYNLRGAAYSVLREFESAKREFQEARNLEPKALDVRFNLAEMDFVTGKFAEALEQFTGMIAENPKMPVQTYHLLRFKEIICLLRLDRQVEARKLVDEFTPYEDTPVYHMANAALHFSAGEEAEARGWVRSARGIFTPQVVSNYLDALIEVGWINSFIDGSE